MQSATKRIFIIGRIKRGIPRHFEQVQACANEAQHRGCGSLQSSREATVEYALKHPKRARTYSACAGKRQAGRHKA